MKNSICGFNQENAVKMGLKGNDLLVLRWLVDFSHSPKMKKKMIDGDVYYWVNYQAVLEDLPILGVDKYQLRRRILKRLVDTKVLKHKQVREKGPGGGTYSYYAFGESYDLLISDDEKVEQNTKSYHPLSENGRTPCGENVTPPVTEMSQQRPFSYSNPSLKQETIQQSGKIRSAAPPHFSKEVQEFVTKTYPASFERIKGYSHPPLSPVQLYRTEQIISEYLGYTSDQDIPMLEAEAEEFITTTKTDGNIRAFATPETMDILLNRI